ncbi:apolipoprotein A1/A4/E family protein [Pseudoduganella aquatica]|uniref:DUF1640 domain-containing protein n=1 Tax=Pseudoduganella aquatica TaxID=2660641 RepID=A0A7X4KM74_9BURK|nr:apolipoprotein A1/A4/E family protein [Pseudoduganella aquatica]MYN07510.1 hypothetical protein [Pseudoduganella aquatica]
MNDIPPLDSPTLADHHEHDTRIIRLEVQMSNVSVTLESMQERVDESHKTTMALIADTAKELHAEHLRVMESLSSSQQHHSDALRAALQHDSDKLSDKLQRHSEEFSAKLQHSSDELSARLQHDGDELRDKLQRLSEEFSARLQHSSDELSARLQHDGDELRAKLQHSSDALDASLEKSCDVFRDNLKQITDSQQSIWEALQREIHRLDSKTDRMNRWVMGLFFTYLVATAALFARPYLNI